MSEGAAPTLGGDDNQPGANSHGSWGGPAAPTGGHVPSSPGGMPATVTPPQPGPADGQTPGANGTTFDPQAFLATLPAEERDELAQLSPAALETYSKRTMLQSDYSRKRGAEKQKLGEMEQQLELMRQQNLLAAELLEQRQAAGPAANGPSVEELGKAFYEAEDAGQATNALLQLVGQAVGPAVTQAIEANPSLRKLRAGAALRSYRGSAPDTTEQDIEEGRQALAQRLQARGASPEMFNEEALEFMLQPEVEAARARRMLQQAQAGTPAPTPAPAPARRTALPVSGSGVSAPTVSPQDKPSYGEGSDLQSRMDATLRAHNLAPGDLARLIRETL